MYGGHFKNEYLVFFSRKITSFPKYSEFSYTIQKMKEQREIRCWKCNYIVDIEDTQKKKKYWKENSQICEHCKKRSRGEKPISVLDSIDLEIWKILIERTATIGEISTKTGIQHKTLKPHLDKMISFKFITAHKEEKTRRIYYSICPAKDLARKLVEIFIGY